MALIIKRNYKFHALDLKEMYVRLSVDLNHIGNEINVTLYPYISKESYKENQSNIINTNDMPRNFSFDYDYLKEKDVLSFAHDSVIEKLTKDEYAEEWKQDPKDLSKNIKIDRLVNKAFIKLKDISKLDI